MRLQDVAVPVDGGVARIKLGVLEPNDLETALRDPAALFKAGGVALSNNFTLKVHANLGPGNVGLAERQPVKCLIKCDVGSDGALTNCEVVNCS